MEKYKDQHEIQAEINAREILLRQSQESAIMHLENLGDGILAKLQPLQRSEIISEVAVIENAVIVPELQTAIRLQSETGVKSKRQIWREEIRQLEAQMATAPEPAGANGEAM